MVFSVLQLQEKCREQKKPLFIAFIDLTKAFDLVSRDGLFKILAKIGCPPKLLSIISVRNSCPSVRPRRISFQSGKQLSRVPCPADRQLFGQFASLATIGQATFKQGKQLCSLACPAGQ